MAESIFISGIAEGVLKEQYEALPAWATEATLGDIQEILKNSLGVQNKILTQLKNCCMNGGKITELDLQDASDEIDKYTKTISKANQQHAKNQEEETKRQKKGATLYDKLAFVMSTVGKAGMKVNDINLQYIKTYDEMFRSGLNVFSGSEQVGDGFKSLNEIVKQTGLRLETIQKVVEKYSSTVNAVGLQKFTKTLSITNARLNDLGYSAEAQTELIAALMDSEIGYRDVRNRSSSQIAEDAIRLGTQMNKLSLTFGISRDKLLENMKATAKSTDSTLVAARWGEDAAKKIAENTAALPEKMRETIAKMAAAGSAVNTEIFKELNAAGMGQLASQLADLAAAGRNINPEEFMARFNQITSTISSGAIAAVGTQQEAGNSAASATLEVVTTMLQLQRSTSQASDAQINAAVKTEQAVAKFQTEMERAAAIPEAVFRPTVEQLGYFTDVVKMANDRVYNFLKPDPSGLFDAKMMDYIQSIATGTLAVAGLAAAAVAAAASLRGASVLFEKTIGGIGKGGGTAAGTAGKVGAMGRLGQAGLLAGAGWIGWEVGENLVAPMIDSMVEGISGVKGQTLGGAIYDWLNPETNINAPTSTKSTTSRVIPTGSVVIEPKSTPLIVPTSPDKQGIASQPVNPAPTEASTETSTTIPNKNSKDINTSLDRQGYILEQILSGTNKIISINSSLLEITKSRA